MSGPDEGPQKFLASKRIKCMGVGEAGKNKRIPTPNSLNIVIWKYKRYSKSMYPNSQAGM